MIGDDVLFEPAVDDAAVERWGQSLLEQLATADRIYQRSGEGWRLHSSKLHEESEQRLGELNGWSDKALDGQRELLKHVDDPGDSGNELEQSLSKLAAAGWNVDSKKDKGPPTVYFAAGDMPLTTGENWKAPGTLHPRFTAALTLLIPARLPALAIADDSASAALLDLRTIAKALRDVGGLDLPDGEPVGPVLGHGAFKLRAVKRKTGATDGAVYGDEAVRFALLYAAAPAKRFAATDDVLGYVTAFLTELHEFAASRLDGATAGARIDGSDGLRRRLAGWCDTAVTRSTENHERLDLHRATRNVITLFTRIKDFDARVTADRGEVTGADRDAIAVALTVLAQLLAPLAPTAASELWQGTGHTGSPADAAWPSVQREPATA
jgi:hypothetical protein